MVEEPEANFGRLPSFPVCGRQAVAAAGLEFLVETAGAKEGSGICFFYLGSSSCSSVYR